MAFVGLPSTLRRLKPPRREVVASGEVLSAAVDSEADGEYRVSVFAEQTTQNVQQPDAGAVPNLLTVTVAEQDGRWIVTDYGPAAA